MEKIIQRVSKRNLTLKTIVALLAVSTLSGCETVGEKVENTNAQQVEYSVADLQKEHLMVRAIRPQKLVYTPVVEKKQATTVKPVAKTTKTTAVKEVKAEKEPEKKSYSDEDLYWLSRVVSSEAKGESEKGQIAVANVVLNRVKSGEFKDTIKGVVFQKNQFSGVYDKSIYDEPTEEAIESAKKALEGKRVIGKDVYYFYNPKTATSRWLDSREVAADIGNHRFTY